MSLDRAAFKVAVDDALNAVSAGSGARPRYEAASRAAITTYNREILANVLPIVERWDLLNREMDDVAMSNADWKTIVEAIKKLVA